LCDSQSTVNLHTGNAVLTVDEEPEASHPLIEAERRILKNRSQFQTELLLALVTKPHAASLDERVLRLAATRANNVAIRPAQLLCVFEAAVRIGEVNDRFLKSIGGIHEENIP
jgi:hypothetical protein